MKIICPREQAVAQAARSGEWQPSLTLHAAECAVCREVAEASRRMQALGESCGENPTLPDAGLLWWKAQLAETLAKANKAQAPLEFAEIAFVVVVAASLTVCAVWNWQELQESAAWLSERLRPQAWMAGDSLHGLTPISFWLIVGAVSLAAIFVAFPALSEE